MHHIKVIKDGNVNNVVKEQLIDGVQYVDDEPRKGSLNGITSGAVAKVAGDVGDVKDVIPEGTSEENPLVNETGLGEVAERVTTAEGDIGSIEGKIPSGASSSNKLVTESDLEAAQDSWQSGFTPKGEATVSQIDALTTQSNGDQYIVTDSGTITAGSIAVVAGDTVAWDSENEVWYKVNQYAKATEQAALTTYAQNVAHSIAPEYNGTTGAMAGKLYMHEGVLYVAKENYTGAWAPSKFTLVDLESIVVFIEIGKSLIDSSFAQSVKVDYNGYAYLVTDGDGRILFGVKKDGSFTWAKGIPAPLVETAERASKITLDESIEYLFTLADYEGRVLLGFRKDGTIDSLPLERKIKSVTSGIVAGLATTTQLTDAVTAERERAVDVESNLQEQIDSMEPTIVEGGSNNPDEFFLTSVDEKLTFKDIASTLYSRGVKYVYKSEDADFSSSNTIYLVYRSIDLGNNTHTIGENSVIVFIGGSVRNGTLVGQQTSLVYAERIFGAGITISGTWIAAKVSSAMLITPGASGALKTLLPLLNAEVFNEFVIEEGSYSYTPVVDRESYITLPSNTLLRVVGTLKINNNGFEHYQIVSTESGAKNIEICGGGSIVGDADGHDYATISGTHEYGYCISVNDGAKGVHIHDINLKDATGDGIDVTADNFKIERVSITHCGRNGISIYHGENGVIENCSITDIYRTAPLFAIDVEPWVEGKKFKNLSVKNITIEDSRGLAALKADNVVYNNISAKNCQYIITLRSAKKVSVSNVNLDAGSLVSNSSFSVDSNSSEVWAQDVTIVDALSGASLDLSNVGIKGYFDYNGSQIFPTNVLEGSTAYDVVSHKLKFFNGSAWEQL